MCGKTKSKKGEPPAQTKGRLFVFTMIRSQDLIAASKIDHFHFPAELVFFVCVLLFLPQCLIRIRLN